MIVRYNVYGRHENALIFSCCRIHIFVVAASGMEPFLFHDSIKTITFGFNFVLNFQI